MKRNFLWFLLWTVGFALGLPILAWVAILNIFGSFSWEAVIGRPDFLLYSAVISGDAVAEILSTIVGNKATESVAKKNATESTDEKKVTDSADEKKVKNKKTRILLLKIDFVILLIILLGAILIYGITSFANGISEVINQSTAMASIRFALELKEQTQKLISVSVLSIGGAAIVFTLFSWLLLGEGKNHN